MKPVLNKHDYYLRWLQGEFGNKLRAWGSAQALLNSDYEGKVTVRSVFANSAKTAYSVTQQTVKTSYMDTEFKFNESAPDEELLIQGEVVELASGLHLFYSHEQTSMRKALQNGLVAGGLKARTILRHYCCPSSYSDLEALFELYPEHVIEFGVYASSLGDIPNRNTIIWEVRKY